MTRGGQSVIKDKNENVVHRLNKDGTSVHTGNEFFKLIHFTSDPLGTATNNPNLTNPGQGGNLLPGVTLTEAGIYVANSEGGLVTLFDESGSLHLKTEIFDDARIFTPLLDTNKLLAGFIAVDSDGFGIYDTNGPVTLFDAEGSSHYKLETYYGGIAAPGGIETPIFDTNGMVIGYTTVDAVGIGIYDTNGFPVTTFDVEGSSHYKPETYYGGIEAPIFDINGTAIGYSTVDSYGIGIYDTNGLPVTTFDTDGSTHYKPETYYGGIEVPIHDPLFGTKLGKIVIDNSGIGIYDANGLSVTQLDAEGLHAFNTPILDDNGIAVGYSTIDSDGIRVRDSDGLPVTIFDAEGSVHYKPEIYYGGIEAPGGINATIRDTNELVIGYGAINSDGIGIYDADGIPVTTFDAYGSTHYMPETYYGGIEAFGGINIEALIFDTNETVIGYSTLNPSGIGIYDSNGLPVTTSDTEGSKHYEPETYYGGIEVPLINPVSGGAIGKTVIDTNGIATYDTNGVPVTRLNADGLTGIRTPILDFNGRTIGYSSIGSHGILIYDANGSRVTVFNAYGSTHHGGETYFGFIEAFGGIYSFITDSNGGFMGYSIIDTNGIGVYDTNELPVTVFDAEGLKHFKPETYYGGIEVPLFDPVLGAEVGKTVIDTNGNALTAYGLTGWGAYIFDRFSGWLLGGTYIGTDGIGIYDTNGFPVTTFDTEGLTHHKPETYLGGIYAPGGIDASGGIHASGGIYVPISDTNGIAVGYGTIDSHGIGIYDTNGFPVTTFDTEGSTHYKPETYHGGIEVPILDLLGMEVGKTVIDSSGFSIYDTNGLPVTTFDPSIGSILSSDLSVNGEVYAQSLHINDPQEADAEKIGMHSDGTSSFSGLARFGDGIQFADGTVQQTASNGHSLNAADGNPANVVVVDNFGNVGIGTSTPEAGLHVIEDRVQIDAAELDLNGQLHASAVIASGNITADLPGFGPALTVNKTSLLEFGGGDLAVFQSFGANRARIDRTGKGYFDGGTQTGGADIAESLEPEELAVLYEPGDVVAISADLDMRATKSDEAYSTRVLGAYSTKPGVLLTDGDLGNKIHIGVLGVIPTKVSAENGPIHRGDLLVSATRPGHAMKGTDTSLIMGAIIGKALQSFDGPGEGRISVLVNVR